jgi:2-dehydropantoate 2-reductase
MKLLIWGAGAIGGTIGAYLARAGHEIILVDLAEDHIYAIQEKGLAIQGPIDTFTVAMAGHTPKTLQGEFDTILLCVKAQATEDACRQLLPFLNQDGVVVSVQNGLNELTIANIVGEHRTLGAFVNFGADYLEPGIIHYGGRGAVVLGELDGRMTPRLKQLHEAFHDFDKDAIASSNIWGFLWSKLAVGSMIFATALTDDPIADAFARPDYQDLFIGIATEVLAVAVARGVTLEPFNGFNPAAFMPGAPRTTSYESLSEMVAFNRRSAKTHTGIWRDLAVRKRKTEVDAQLATVIPLGHELNLKLPLVSKLVELIHDIENGNREQSTDNLRLLRDAQEAHDAAHL